MGRLGNKNPRKEKIIMGVRKSLKKKTKAKIKGCWIS
jgi:hypothetical protein